MNTTEEMISILVCGSSVLVVCGFIYYFFLREPVAELSSILHDWYRDRR